MNAANTATNMRLVMAFATRAIAAPMRANMSIASGLALPSPARSARGGVGGGGYFGQRDQQQEPPTPSLPATRCARGGRENPGAREIRLSQLQHQFASMICLSFAASHAL